MKTLEKVFADNKFRLIIGNEDIIAIFQKVNYKINIKDSKNLIEDITTYLMITDLPLPFNALNLIQNKRKMGFKFIIKIISILYSIKIIDLIAFLREFLKDKTKLKHFLKKYFRIIKIL